MPVASNFCQISMNILILRIWCALLVGHNRINLHSTAFFRPFVSTGCVSSVVMMAVLPITTNTKKAR